MRLGDLDALKEDLKESKEQLWEIYNGLSNHIDKQICAGQIGTFTEAILRIKDAPTIDAVPVCRCKDCKYGWTHIYQTSAPAFHCIKAFGGKEVDPMDFCSYGERKDGEG